MRLPTTKERNDQLRALLRMVDARLPGEGAHAERVAVYATAIGHELGLRGNALLQLRYAATLHDVGKSALDPEPLLRKGPLEPEERVTVQGHVTLAEALVDAIEWLRPTLPAIRHHHERWDGDGYPDKLSGEDIPLDARIIAVAEAFDAMQIWGVSEERALDEVRAQSGKQFDPKVVAAFLKTQPLIQPLGT